MLLVASPLTSFNMQQWHQSTLVPRRRLGASFAHLVSCTVHEDKSFCSDIVCVRFKVESPGGQYLFQPFSTKVRHGGTILIEPLAYLLQSSCSTVFSSHSFRLFHVSWHNDSTTFFGQLNVRLSGELNKKVLLVKVDDDKIWIESRLKIDRFCNNITFCLNYKWYNLFVQCQLCYRQVLNLEPSNSTTRFGEFSPLWHNFKSLRQIFEG